MAVLWRTCQFSCAEGQQHRVMARLQKWEESPEEDFVEPEAPSAPAPDPLWEWFKADPQWQTDRWVLRPDASDIKR